MTRKRGKRFARPLNRKAKYMTYQNFTDTHRERIGQEFAANRGMFESVLEDMTLEEFALELFIEIFEQTNKNP
jgi:hypothetical protein